MRKKFYTFVCINVFLLQMLSAQSKRPNILYIMSDDHTTEGIGAYRGRLSNLNPTPTIDRIANEGILFENAYCVSSICRPSRATIMTGQYGHINGVPDLTGNLPEKRQYLAHEMKKLGYHTAIIGKWHLKDAPSAFDYYNVFPGQGKYHNPVMYSSEPVAKKTVIDFDGPKRAVNATFYKGHSSDIITDQSLDWLKNKRDKSKPFFLMHHFKAPHDLFEFAARYKDYLENVTIPEPASLWDNKNNGSVATRGVNNSQMDTIGSSVGKRNTIRNMGMHMDIDPTLSSDEYKRESYQEYIKRYLRCVKGVDDNIKRLFDYLEKENLMDNTIIMYTGDQGFMLGEHDYIDKRWMYEESMRMPFLVRYPKMIKAGIKSKAIINNTDFAPTIIDLAGGKTPQQMQGESFTYILKKGKEPKDWRQETYYRYWMHMAHRHSNPAHLGIRTKKYKLIFFYARDFRDRTAKFASRPTHPVHLSQLQTPVAWELYDIVNDPHEMNNIYGDKKYTSVVKELKQKLVKLREEVKENDSMFPEIQKVIDEHWDD